MAATKIRVRPNESKDDDDRGEKTWERNTKEEKKKYHGIKDDTLIVTIKIIVRVVNIQWRKKHNNREPKFWLAHINLSHSNIQNICLLFDHILCLFYQIIWEWIKKVSNQVKNKATESQMEIKWLEDSCVESNLIRWTRRWNECHGLVGFAWKKKHRWQQPTDSRSEIQKKKKRTHNTRATTYENKHIYNSLMYHLRIYGVACEVTKATSITLYPSNEIRLFVTHFFSGSVQHEIIAVSAKDVRRSTQTHVLRWVSGTFSDLFILFRLVVSVSVSVLFLMRKWFVALFNISTWSSWFHSMS